MNSDVATVKILGVTVALLTESAALRAVIQLYRQPKPALVAYANAHTLNLACQDPEYRSLLRSAAIVFNDGAGIAVAARIRGARFPANLNGSDFNSKIFKLAAVEGWRVYLLGGRPGVAKQAARKLSQATPQLQICGVQHGYFDPYHSVAVAEAIREADTGLLIVAMGNPLQEQWLQRYLEQTGARMGVGVGAFLDFSAGVVSRAPVWMNKVGIEWVYRLIQEPRRMWRRYLLGNPLFLARVLQEQVMGQLA